MRSVRTIARVSPLLILFLLVATDRAEAAPATLVHPTDYDFQRRLEANQLRMWMTNFGSFAYDINAGASGLIFPRGTDRSVIFASGLWLAGIDGQNNTLVTAVDYFPEYAPGGMTGPTSWDLPTDFRHIVYKVIRWTGDPQDSALVMRSVSELAADPSLDPVAHHSWSQYMGGAVPFGAPWRLYRLPDTSTPDPTDSVDVAGPDVLGDQMLWAVYNDADPTFHFNQAGSTAPLDVEVQQTAFAFAHDDSLANTIFLRFKIIRRGLAPLTSAYVALWVDPNVGGPNDDLAGCDPAAALGYAYNGPGSDTVYGAAAPAVGYDLFTGPVAAAGDTLGLTSFNRWLNGTDPQSHHESYSYMRGLQPGDLPLIDPTTGLITPYSHSGDPVAGTGWRDSLLTQGVLVRAFYDDVDTAHAPPFAGVDFGGEFFNGGADAGWAFHDFNFGGKPISSLDPATQPDSFPSVDIVFFAGPTQKAYRYLRLEQADGSLPAPGRAYRYGGFRDVPFAVLDHDVAGEYEVGFVERMKTDAAGNPLAPGLQPASFDSTWAPDTSATGGYETIVVFRRPYSGSPDPAFAKDGVFADTTRANRPPVLFVLSAKRVDLTAVADDGDQFRYVFPVHPNDNRMLLSSGPFTFAPGDTQNVLAGIVVGQGDSRLASITSLRAFDAYAQRQVRQGLVFLSPPNPARDTLFTDRTDFGTGAPPTGMAAGDLDKDGKLDLAVVSGFVDSLWIYHGRGDGTFDPPVSYATGPNVHAVTIGDLNADTFPDVVTANDGDNTVSVFYGSPGGFAPSGPWPGAGPPSPLRTDFGTGSGPIAVAIGNVIGDAAPDLVVVGATADSITVLRGSSGGLTPTRADFGTGAGPAGVAIGDVNGDALPDVLVTSPSTNTVGLFRGAAGGLDPNRADFGTGSAPVGVALGKLNGDTLADVVVTNIGSNTVSIRLGSPGGLAPDRTDFGTGAFPVGVVVADVNGDGLLDVATADRNANAITVLHGRGDGTLADRTSYPTGSNPAGLVVGDFDGDGHPDLLAANTGSSSVTTYSNQDHTVPTLASLVSADVVDGRVRISWYAPRGPGAVATVYRREESSAWMRVAAVLADGSGLMEFTDTDVRPGARYGYRLGVLDAGRETFVGEVWVSVTALSTLSLVATVNPSHQAALISFALPERSPAMLEMFDVRGRRVLARDVGALGLGSHVIRVGADRELGSGLYFLRLKQAGHEVDTRMVLLR